MKKINLSKPIGFAIGYLVLTAVLTRFDPLNVIGNESESVPKLLNW